MNIIEAVAKDFERYIKVCYDSFSIELNSFKIDYSKGGTDICSLLSIEKSNYSKSEAIALLTMSLMMHEEEWNDLKSYTKDDLARWHKILVSDYETGIYFPIVHLETDVDRFLLERLNDNQAIREIHFNEAKTDFDTFQNIQPLKANILNVSKVTFNHLEVEFYIETETHFVLLNWFTSA